MTANNRWVASVVDRWVRGGGVDQVYSPICQEVNLGAPWCLCHLPPGVALTRTRGLWGVPAPLESIGLPGEPTLDDAEHTVLVCLHWSHMRTELIARMGRQIRFENCLRTPLRPRSAGFVPISYSGVPGDPYRWCGGGDYGRKRGCQAWPIARDKSGWRRRHERWRPAAIVNPTWHAPLYWLNFFFSFAFVKYTL